MGSISGALPDKCVNHVLSVYNYSYYSPNPPFLCQQGVADKPIWPTFYFGKAPNKWTLQSWKLLISSPGSSDDSRDWSNWPRIDQFLTAYLISVSITRKTAWVICFPYHNRKPTISVIFSSSEVQSLVDMVQNHIILANWHSKCIDVRSRLCDASSR